jgi:SsrA-binding protein
MNRRARHDYEILDTLECGVVLTGSEVKSLRAGRVSLQDAYAKVDHGELWLYGAHIPAYEHASGFGAHAPDRARKLLVHRRELDGLLGKTQQRSLTLVPLRLYFKGSLVKVELALARGKRLWDKRRAIAERTAAREAAREAARAMRRRDLS